MAKIIVHAGDFLKKNGSFSGGILRLCTEDDAYRGKAISLSKLESIEIATEESVKRIGGTVGWGLAGLAVLGPFGALAGLLVGGRGKQVTFVARFKGGRKLLATTDSKTFTKLQAAAFENEE
jgi:hypothetical protein